QFLNLGGGEPLSLADFIHTIEEIIGKSARIQYTQGFTGDTPKSHADITKAKNMIGYEPCVSIKDGLYTMYQWYINEYLPFNYSKCISNLSDSVICCL